MANQQAHVAAGGSDNIVVQIEGDQNSVQIGARPKLILTRFAAQRRPPPNNANRELLQLSPYTLSTTLVGRKRELADLGHFIRSELPISVRVLTGSGGTGKTRLALHLCEQLTTEGWQAGFATSDAFRKFNNQPNRAEWGWSRPTLVVLDYAASHTELLKDWLDALADRLGQEPAPAHPLRILLLERHASMEAGWMNELFASGGWAAIGGRQQLLDPHEPVAVPPLAEAADRAALINQMLQRNSADMLQVSAEFVEQHLSQATWGGDPLFLMMAALYAAEQRSLDALALRRTDLALKLAEREGHRLDLLAAAHAPTPLNPKLLRHLTACVTLAQGLPRDTFLPLAAQETQATGHPTGGDPADLHDLLARALPPGPDGHLPPLLPDLIGEAFVLATFKARHPTDADLQRLHTTLGQKMIETLVRCAQDFARQDTDAPLPWLHALAQQAAGDWQRLQQIGKAIPVETVILRALNLETTQLRTQALARATDVADETRAWHLHNAAIAYAQIGRREEALQAMYEAVEIRRHLAGNRPDAFRPNLARSLNDIATFLSDLGRHQEALQAAHEGVESYRSLAKSQPHTFRPDLAMSLSNFAMLLRHLGRHEEALQAVQETVEILRSLTENRTDAFQANLAMSLNNVAICLSALGRREEALQATQKAVEIYRVLAENRPDAFRHNLAMSLHNFGNCLSALDKCEEALQATQKAIEIRRALAENRPDAFRPDLAMSLNNLANRMSALGRSEEALQAAQEAVAIRRVLAENHPHRFLPDLAMSLMVLGLRQNEIGQAAESIYSLAKAMQTLQPYFIQRPGFFRELMATTVRSYTQFIEATDIKPDMKLLTQIQQVFHQLHAAPAPEPGEPT